MVDLPQHAALISLFLNMGNPDFAFHNEFQINLFTPYLLGYLLIAALSPLLGVVTASKLLIGFALFSFSLSTRFVLRKTGADPYWAWLVFPTLYGFSYQWGFLNFLIAAPIGILFLDLVWRKIQSHSIRSSLLIMLTLYVLFFSHALIMGLFSLIALGYWMFTARQLSDFLRRAWPMFALAPLVIAWFALASKHPQTSHPIEWDLSWISTTDGYYSYIADWINPENRNWGRITGFIPRMLGVRPNIIVIALGIMLFALPFLAGGRMTKSRKRLVPLGAVTLLLLFLPSVLFGNVFTVQRFSLLAMPLFLITINSPIRLGAAQQYIRLCAPVIAFSWIAFMSINALQLNKESDDFEVIMTKMEPQKTAMSLIFSRDDGHSIAPTFINYPAWYSAVKEGIVHPSFAEFTGMPVGYKPEYTPRASIQGVAWNPKGFNWQTHEGYKYDYFLIRSPVNVSSYIFRSAPCPINLAAQSGMWWLYRPESNCKQISPVNH